MFYDDNDKIIHCNFGKNGISIDDHDAIWNANNNPKVTIYRYTASGTKYTPPVDTTRPTPKPGKVTLNPYSGVFYPDRQLPVSADTNPKSGALAYYSAGMAVVYDSYTFANGYAWISYLDMSGTRRYLAVGPDDGKTTTVWGTGFLNNNPGGTGVNSGLIAYKGVFYPNMQLPVSADTNPKSPAVAYYTPGMPIIFDSYVFTNGYAWISYIGSSGNRRYVAVGPDDGRTDTVWGTGFLGNVNHGTTQLHPGPGRLVPKGGQFVPDRRLPVSADTSASSPEVAFYVAGNVINYDSYIFTNGYAWISYVTSSGARRYVAVGPDDGNSRTVWGHGFFN